MKVPGLDPLPPSSKKVWRLKKYTKSSSEIQQEQQEYANLEFSPKKSSRRPKNKPGEQQEFVFVDLSPRKKSPQKSQPRSIGLPQPVLGSSLDLPPQEMPPLSNSPEASTASSSSSTKSTESSHKRHSLSRLFRLSSQEPPRPQLMESPDLVSSVKPQLAPVLTEVERPGRPSFSSRASSPLSQPLPPQLKRTTTPQLVMCVSSDGRAVLQPSSASSSTTDLFSLHSQHRSPSPKREAESPLEYVDSTDEETQDACRAFERAVRRKRANTAGSQHSITRSSLSRTHSISSMSSVYRGNAHARMSPSRAAMLRQTTPVESRPPPMEDFVGSFFDDASKEGRRPMGHLRQQKSISTLGPALGMSDTFDADLTLTKSIHNVDQVGVDDNLAEFFDFSAFGEEQFHLQDI